MADVNAKGTVVAPDRIYADVDGNVTDEPEKRHMLLYAKGAPIPANVAEKLGITAAAPDDENDDAGDADGGGSSSDGGDSSGDGGDTPAPKKATAKKAKKKPAKKATTKK